MTLTEEERKKIEEKDKPKKKKGVGCLTAIIVVVVCIGIFGAIVSSQIPSTKNNSSRETPTISYSSNVGKYGYNKTNGVYIGKIISVKQCKTAPKIQCYEIDQGAGYSRPSEHPVDNVTIKDQSTQPTQATTPTSTPTPIVVNKVDYEIVSYEENKTVENYWLLIKSGDKSKQTLEMFVKNFKKEKCKKECNISLYDNKRAIELDLNYNKITNPTESEKWKQENYIYVADHLIGWMSFELDLYQEYPYKDWYYKELKSN